MESIIIITLAAAMIIVNN